MADNSLTPAAAARLAQVAERTKEFGRAARAKATRTLYGSGWRRFESWCRTHGLSSELPVDPRHVAMFLTDLSSELKTGSLECYLRAVKARHEDAGIPFPYSPALDQVWEGIRRSLGTESTSKKAVTPDVMHRLLETCPPDTPLGKRNRAILLFGYASALRRSELVGLDVEHLIFSDDGVDVRLGRTKGDQEAKGETVSVPYGRDPDFCPVRSLRLWLEAAEITRGPVFRPVGTWVANRGRRLTAGTVAHIVKTAAEEAGLNPEEFSGHSLRSGLATTAAMNGADVWSLMGHMRHKSPTTTAKYVQQAERWKKNAAGKVF